MNMNTMSQELRIGDLVGRTGVAEPTLRMWERRHGFPEPTRTPSGHRRYTEDHVDQILRVLAGRMAGLSLKAAIERARGGEAIGSLSMFATLRRHAPDLRPCLLHKRAMIALSHAIEDESLGAADAGLLQRAVSRQAEARWHRLSRVWGNCCLRRFWATGESAPRTGRDSNRDAAIPASRMGDRLLRAAISDLSRGPRATVVGRVASRSESCV